MSNIAWCFALYSSFTTLLLRVVSSIFIDFILVSVLISTITWAYANKFLVSSNQDRDYPPFDQEQKVEWLYAFDIHCNSYFTMFLYTHIISFLLIPLYFYKRESILVTLISNILLGLAISLYFYTTSHGFTGMIFNFLQRINRRLTYFSTAIFKKDTIILVSSRSTSSNDISSYYIEF